MYSNLQNKSLRIESYMAKNIGFLRTLYVFARMIVLQHRRENI